MKKLFILLLTLSLSAPCFASANNAPANNNYAGNMPLIEIGVSDELLKPQQEEKGLEIVWNKWRADVANKKINNDVHSTENYLIYLYFTVHSDKSITDTVAIYIPESSMTLYEGRNAIKANAYFYVYSRKANKYYKATFDNDVPVKNAELFFNDYSYNILTKMKMTQTGFFAIKNFEFIIGAVNKIEKFSGKSFLEFPEGSERTFVVASTNRTNIKWLNRTKKYSEDDFDDIERL